MQDNLKQWEDASWEAMATLLDKEMPQEENKRRPFWFWLLGIGMGIALGVSITLFWHQKNHSSTPEKAPDLHQAAIETPPVQEEIKTEPLTNDIQEGTSVLTTNETNQERIKSKTTTPNTVVKTQSIIPITTNNSKPALPQESSISNEITKTVSNKSLIEEASLSTTNEITEGVNDTKSTIKKEKITSPRIPNSALTNVVNDSAPQEINDLLKLETTKIRVHDFSMRLGAGVGNHWNSYNLGAFYRLLHKRKWSLETGLNYTAFQFNHGNSFALSTAQDATLFDNSIENEDTSTATPASGGTPNTSTTIEQSSDYKIATTNFHAISLPIELSYQLTPKWAMVGSIAPAFSFRPQNLFSRNEDSVLINDPVNEEQKNLRYRTFYQTTLRFSPSARLYLDAQFKGEINLTERLYPVQQIELGLGWRF